MRKVKAGQNQLQILGRGLEHLLVRGFFKTASSKCATRNSASAEKPQKQVGVASRPLIKATAASKSLGAVQARHEERGRLDLLQKDHPVLTKDPPHI